LDEHRIGFTVTNKSSEPVDVIYVRGENRIVVADNLGPGLSNMVNGYLKGGECGSDSIVATDQAGSVVAMFAGPVCDGTMWEIRVATPSPS
jgi:hypothetical protein